MKQVLTIVFFFLWGCTENPFFGDDSNSIQSATITGEVRLLGDIDSTAYVTMRGFGKIVATNQKRRFSFSIPPAILNTSLNTSLNSYLYFWSGNYYVDSAQVFITDGQITPNAGALDQNLELKEIIYLTPRLQVSNSGFYKDTVNKQGELQKLFVVTTRLDSKQDQVMYTALTGNGEFNKFAIEHFDGRIIEYRTSSVIYHTNFNLNDGITFIRSNIITDKVGLIPGAYKVYPIISVYEPKLPEEFKSRFSNLSDLNSYLDYPFYQTKAVIEFPDPLLN